MCLRFSTLVPPPLMDSKLTVSSTQQFCATKISKSRHFLAMFLMRKSIYCLLRPKSPNSLSLNSKIDVLNTSITENVRQVTDPYMFSIEVRSRMTWLRHLPEIRSLLRFWRQNSNFEKDVGETWSRRGQDVGTFYVVETWSRGGRNVGIFYVGETWSRRRHFLRGQDVGSVMSVLYCETWALFFVYFRQI